MAETEIRELWAMRWPDGTTTGSMYGDDAEQTMRFLAEGSGATIVRRTETINRTDWEPAPTTRVAPVRAQLAARRDEEQP